MNTTGNYKHGRYSNNKICKICNKKISRSATHCGSCATKIQIKDARNNPNWNGGRIISSNNYIYIHIPEHPFSNTLGYVAEHRLVMEKKLGRKLTSEEVVHHINEIRTDNRIENLLLFKSNSEHRKFHSGFVKYIMKNYQNLVQEYVKNFIGEKYELYSN